MPAARPHPESLWRQPDFLKLWIGQSISEVGSRITRDGLPLVAVLTLGASPAQMGVITAVGSLVVLLTSMPAGVWIDRLRRRPILIAADIGRALAIGSIPVAALTHHLRIELLYVVVSVAAALTVLFEAAYEAYLPALVDREHLLEGNSKLQFSDSTAEVLGPGLAGVLVQLLTAPVAMLVDALSFLASIGSLALIRRPEPPPRPARAREPLVREMVEGVRYVWRDRILRAFALSGGMHSFFGSFFGVLYALFAIRELGLSPAALGATIAVGGAGGLLGALVTGRATRRWGLGRALIGAQILSSLTAFLIPLARGPVLVATLMLMTAQLLGDGFNTVSAIDEVSLRQSITPDQVRGRVGVSLRWLIAGVGPIGALVGGVLAEAIGVRQTLLIATVGVLLSSGWLLLSPIRRVAGGMPEPPQ